MKLKQKKELAKWRRRGRNVREVGRRRRGRGSLLFGIACFGIVCRTVWRKGNWENWEIRVRTAHLEEAARKELGKISEPA